MCMIIEAMDHFQTLTVDTFSLSVCLSVFLYKYIPPALFVCLSVCLSICLYVCLSVCLSPPENTPLAHRTEHIKIVVIKMPKKFMSTALIPLSEKRPKAKSAFLLLLKNSHTKKKLSWKSCSITFLGTGIKNAAGKWRQQGLIIAKELNHWPSVWRDDGVAQSLERRTQVHNDYSMHDQSSSPVKSTRKS